MQVKATDYSNNSRTNTYQLVVTNNGLAKTLLYDANGNLTNAFTSAWTNSYEWDGADRLTKITFEPAGFFSHTSQFEYDGLGRRVKMTETTNATLGIATFVWCGLELCEQRDMAGGTVSKRFFGQGEQLSGAAHFFTRDHLGSVREMTDSGGTIKARYEYDPYGRRTKVSGDLNADFAFTGHYYHRPSGLHLAPYRAYDAETGRWISRDPIEETGGLNLYGYVNNNPISFVDPFGLAIGDWWDARTWFNSGFTESWSDQANSIGQTLGDLLAGKWDNFGNNYDDSTLGQAEAAGPGVHKATKICIGTATAATAAATTVIGLEAVGLIETTPQANNVIRIISKPLKRGIRLDKPHHGKWYHWQYWKW